MPFVLPLTASALESTNTAKGSNPIKKRSFAYSLVQRGNGHSGFPSSRLSKLRLFEHFLFLSTQSYRTGKQHSASKKTEYPISASMKKRFIGSRYINLRPTRQNWIVFPAPLRSLNVP